MAKAHDEITVDDNFVRVGGKSYATNKITSVEVREHPSTLKGCASLLLVVGIIGLVGSIAAPPLFVVTVPMVALGVALLKKSKQMKYQLFLITSAAEQHALDTGDKELVYGLRDRIEQAMIKGSGH